MDFERFKRLLLSFADDPTTVVLDRGEFAFEMGSEVLSGKLKGDPTNLIVLENGLESSAKAWICRRVAQLPILARRLIEHCPVPESFIQPRGTLDTFSMLTQDADNVGQELQKQLGEGIPGSCSVLYLTSDAGEGKSTVINHVARECASKYATGASDWLLIPVNLGGRTFLRFDDVIVASLMNQFRFPRLYFEAFVELVRLGVLVPALDGFEEVFVETNEGEAVSSLGNLLRQLNGEGRVLIAARKAYFEYKKLETQSKLLDALSGVDVTFAKLTLKRWGEEEFVRYAASRRVPEPRQLYMDVVARVSADHPVLTRAVLVKRLVDVAGDIAHRQTILSSLRPDTHEFFDGFIDTILERESQEKWLDKGGEAATPLLTSREHRELLGLLSEEMWTAKTGVLSSSLCDSVAELFCEHKGKTPSVSRQVKERLKQHALIVKANSTRDGYSFDHEHFREYFLGEQLAAYICAGSTSETRRLIRGDLLPIWVVDVVAHFIKTKGAAVNAVRLLNDIAPSEGQTSFVRENAGSIAVGLIGGIEDTEVRVLTEHLFPTGALERIPVKRVSFRGCHFRPTGLHPAATDVLFDVCTFERLELAVGVRYASVLIDDSCKVHCVAVRAMDDTFADVYDPNEIESELKRFGLRGGAPVEVQEEFEWDDELRAVDRTVRAFQRNTHLHEGTIRLRLSVLAHLFFTQVIGDLEKNDVLVQMPHRGSGTQQRHWRLGRSLHDISRCLGEARGSYARFLELVGRS